MPMNLPVEMHLCLYLCGCLHLHVTRPGMCTCVHICECTSRDICIGVRVHSSPHSCMSLRGRGHPCSSTCIPILGLLHLCRYWQVLLHMGIIFMHICTYVFLYVCVHVLFELVSVDTSLCMCICMCVCVCFFTLTWVYRSICVYVYFCVDVYACLPIIVCTCICAGLCVCIL